MEDNKQFLYRYRHLNGQHREWTKSIITDSVLYFANPTKFNDPFDCKVHYQRSFSSKKLKHRYIDQLKQRVRHLNRAERRAKAKEDTRNLDSEEFRQKITTGFQNVINKIGVLSLSESDCNILLWSHYANCHKGLCLKFKATDQTPFFGRALPVEYVSSYPEISITSSPEKQINAFLLTKAIDWQYEKEHRIIDHENGDGNKRFPPELLVGVILGAQMVPSDKKAVAEWVNKRKDCIELLEATVADGSFALEIRPYMG